MGPITPKRGNDVRTLITNILLLLAMQVPAAAQYRSEGEARRAENERVQMEYRLQREREERRAEERAREREREQRELDARMREAQREAAREAARPR